MLTLGEIKEQMDNIKKEIMNIDNSIRKLKKSHGIAYEKRSIQELTEQKIVLQEEYIRLKKLEIRIGIFRTCLCLTVNYLNKLF